MIKAMIVDDHIMVRESIKYFLEMDGDIKVIDEASDGIDCIEKLKKLSPDILLLDINMPNMNGIEVLKKMKEEDKLVKILLFTAYEKTDFLLQAFDLGVDGYILKKSNSKELKKAINIIISGDSYIQPSLLPLLNSRLISRNLEQKKIKLLTKREMEILIQVAGGMFNKEIAINLNISERTVKNHLSNIFKKIDVSDRTQAAVFAIRNNIVQLY
ncbi:DNA-binding response regulator [Parablautia intestinalis]|jgi:two-component system response regulator DegU|uniref:Stage 0 sporulation protein A homolog n=1 Tax=Parablautia intestinalis TaxID=2320100 RepID=A0A3A9B032_9FIRM|nr:response regulator transcription factor [Parablautia intestinalis]MCI8615193.1 response regulator transcription factor [Lachnospiraceae bacterium]RKI92005.1 DNA-binding response regulator [Parablautia intestinalis]